MKLQAAVNDLREVCPKKFEREAGAEAGECDVPSQPMLEWLSLKLLGGSILLARTMERCTKAFLLTQQHMSVGEYIVVNVVVTSMLSRLWVFFKGILRALIPMYGRINNLLQEVSCSHPMVYLTNFTLPKDLSEYLCLSFPHPLIQEVKEPFKAKKRKTKFAVLNQLFGGNEQKAQEEQKVMTMAVRHSESSGLDLGAAVPYREVVSHCGVDIKDMLLSSCKTSQQETLKKQTDARQASVCQKMKFLKMLKKVSCFRTMSAFLKQVMTWCRRCKFLHERKRLAFLSLKCVRMESLQAEGVW
ncbi:hypothetical protein DNTS_027192 [Danionella cerebrum]|uniref:Nucleolus and neural progenitor protein-like N-terminal domain-containing protein n=1 Tax=Danionella cerebrum TaxID=2873325 RepID=A0A553QPC7_9TELE|nr:hypothetical protein DNTS_027192 [Danionella translucida]TRY91840.1 hypothetical protein DNTS_027192 [Danionella translucida]